MVRIPILFLLSFGFGRGDDYVVVSTTELPKKQEPDFMKDLKVELNATLTAFMAEMRREFQETCESKITKMAEETKRHVTSELNRMLEKVSPTPKQKLVNTVQNVPESCQKVNNKTGIYPIQPVGGLRPFFVYCDMETEGGGWIHVLRRSDGSQNFDLAWKDYKSGFGDLSGEFWLGLEHLYQLTTPGLTEDEPVELLVELVDWDSRTVRIRYASFRIGSEQEGYVLESLGSSNGEFRAAFVNHVGKKFTTKDKENDEYNLVNCAVRYFGGWWYHGCFHCKLTGKYYQKDMPKSKEGQGIHWNSFHNDKYSLKEARMMIRGYQHN